MARPKTYLTENDRHNAEKEYKLNYYYKNKTDYLERQKKSYYLKQEFKRLCFIEY